LAPSKSLDSPLRRLGILILDVNFANTKTGTGTGGTRDLGLDDGTILLTLLFDVFFDFCDMVSKLLWLQCLKKIHTIIFLIIDQLVGSDHVHEANHTAVLEVLSSASTGQHGDGTDSAIEASSLLHTNCGTGHLEVAVTEGDVVQAFDNRIDDFVVGIFAESDTLTYVSA
jgi:hypothetical protein